jgi:trehalose-phosphatase
LPSPSDNASGALPLADIWSTWRSRVRSAEKITLFLDFDGTLVRIASHPDEVKLTRKVAAVLRGLAARSGVWVVILSGRPREDLARFFKFPDIVLLGSHGYEMPLPVQVIPILERAREVCRRGAGELERALERFPGAWLELKPSGASVHYRRVDPEHHGEVTHLVSHWQEAEPARIQSTVLRPARKAVEIRPRVEWGKGSAARWWLEAAGPAEARGALALVAGDDDTDEDMFRVFDAEGFTLRVGGVRGATAARAWVETPDEVWRWLEEVEGLRRDRRG